MENFDYSQCFEDDLHIEKAVKAVKLMSSKQQQLFKTMKWTCPGFLKFPAKK